MPKISVIVPVYNTEKYLEKCLDSLINQTMNDIEIIVVNDGSPDNSQEIIDRYKELYPDKIKCFVQENKGQAAARNFGIRQATGEFISFVDSDDYLEPETYDTVYTYAEQNNSDIVCFGMFEDKGEGEKTVCDYCLFDHPDNRIKYILNETSPCNKLISRELFTQNGIAFKENLIYEDLELIPQLALYTDKISFLNKPFYNYVIHAGSTMRQKKYNEKLSSIYTVMDSLKTNFEKTEYKKELEFLFIEHLLHGATLRYLDYEEGVEDIKKIGEIMKQNFPKWRKNIYYKKNDFKYKIFCELAYSKNIGLLKAILGK